LQVEEKDEKYKVELILFLVIFFVVFEILIAPPFSSCPVFMCVVRHKFTSCWVFVVYYVDIKLRQSSGFHGDKIVSFLSVLYDASLLLQN
jgi:hypothetical protein